MFEYQICRNASGRTRDDGRAAMAAHAAAEFRELVSQWEKGSRNSPAPDELRRVLARDEQSDNHIDHNAAAARRADWALSRDSQPAESRRNDEYRRAATSD